MKFNSLISTHQLLRTQVYDYLRRELKTENLKPGMFISINQLVKTLEISRTPLRDALLQLQTEGFLTVLPQRGIRVNDLTQQDIENMYEMLGALDSLVILSLFNKIDSLSIEQMRQINLNMYANISEERFY